MAASLAALTDPGARSVYIKYLAETVDIEETAILEKMRQVSGRVARNEIRRQAPAERPQPEPRRSSRIERQLVAMMLQFPDILPEMRKQKIVTMLEDPTLRDIAQDALGGSERTDLDENSQPSDHDYHRRLKAQLSLIQEDWDYRGCMRIIQHFVSTRRRKKSAPLDAQIKQAEMNHDEERLQELLKEKQAQVLRVRRQQMKIEMPKEVD